MSPGAETRGLGADGTGANAHEPEIDRAGVDAHRPIVQRSLADMSGVTATDSAGTPWAGRRFLSNPHTNDDGRMPEPLRAVLAQFHRGEVDQDEVVREFARSRLLVPLLTELGDGGAVVGAHGLAIDKSQELSIVTVTGPEGRRALPTFSSVESMARWNRNARPVPSDGVRVALAAASDGTELVVLDPRSDTEFVVRRPALWAIGQSREWQVPWRSELVRSAFERSIERELAVLAVSLMPGDPQARLQAPELIARLQLIAGLTRGELDAVTERLARRWATDDAIAEGVDSLAVQLVTAGLDDSESGSAEWDGSEFWGEGLVQ
ncbi:MAG: hypothetical protein B5766_12475 [Candidatus Lumbricidophila eiseniae]|uniref:SseB protein N-terminal domain-containing protein n=1 Tax=Candidatus Lumbricidiphila eiseniae TaxID=1969409 RepID=A0A2A6FNJ4_9MICO|nr:MAG: hypothetical protein B5766_12475 [Candidatus Lumbricidophila eiseniae]